MRQKEEGPGGGSGKPRFPISYVIVGLMLLMLLHAFFSSPAGSEIPYSEFKRRLAQGDFQKVILYETKIVGELRDDRFGSVGDDDLPLGMGGKRRILSAVRPEDPELIKLLDEKGIEYLAHHENNRFWEIFLSWVVPIALMIFLWNALFKRIGPGTDVLTFGKNRAKLYMEKDSSVTFEDVAGQDEAKEELEEVIEFLRTPERFQALGGKLPKGILLVGPPGTGKTLLARAVAGEAKVPFFNISGSDFVEMFVGVGASRIRDLFGQAREKAPCIVFIDELDAVGKARGVGMIGGHDEREQTLNQLLVEMDGFDTLKGMIIMAATNRPEILDPALLRPGRFDRQIVVGRPDIRGREEILKVHTKKVKLGPDVDFKKLAAQTPGLVGADLANIVNEAALLAARKNKTQVEMSDFQEATERVIGGLEKKNRVINQKEKEIVAHHEAGHALVSAFCPTADKVHKISIIPRGVSALGYTLNLPTEDRYLMTKQELLERVDVLLGGRVAEEIIFGDISTGAQNDLQRATDIVRSMVLEYGMGQTLGPVTYPRNPHRSPLDGIGESREYSEKTAEAIDLETKRIFDERLQRVRTLLEEKKELLERIARALLDKEQLDGEAFERIISEFEQEKRKAGERPSLESDDDATAAAASR